MLCNKYADSATNHHIKNYNASESICCAPDHANLVKLMSSSLQRDNNAVIRLATISHLPGVLEELGADPQTVVRAAGLSLSAFADPEFRVPYTKMGELLALCVRETHCQYFGLLVGQRIVPSGLGLLGFLMQSAKTVREALHDYMSFAGLQDQGAVSLLKGINGVTLLSYSIYVDGVEAEEQIYDGTMAGHQNIMRGLCGESFKPTEILLSRPKPNDSIPYERFFKAPIRYNSEISAIVFQTTWLELAPVRTDPLLHNFLEEEAKKQFANLTRSTREKIRPVLRRLLIGQICTLEETAAQLGLHSRTLNRRLKAEGTTFQVEVDAARYLMARQFLLGSTQSIAEIAAIVGYSDTSAFTNAFKRWSGVSPSEWRALETRGADNAIEEQ